MALVGIVDCRISNLASVGNALDHLKIPRRVVSRPDELEAVTHVILPGVGTFARGMANLKSAGLDIAIRDCAARGKPVLGLCLGMQLLAEWGEEAGPCPGLGLLPGRVDRLRPAAPGLRLPHVGWNEIAVTRPSRTLASLRTGDSFYFLHSYGYRNAPPEVVVATCEYGGEVIAVVERGNVCGVQFHPEKSQRAGLGLLRSFVAPC